MLQESSKSATFYENKLAFETDSYDVFMALQAQDNVIVVDARSPESYAREHIPGAISFPHRTMSPTTTTSLDRSSLYITYCDGIGCNASTKGALKLSELGFRVKELLGGLDWWKRDGYATEGNAAQSGTQIDCGCAA
jgi:rhodanese-related sulfurtransferase